MLRPTPWRTLLEFHLIDFAFMSAEHDVSAKPLSRKVPTKRHPVAYKLSRWDASDSHLFSLPLLHVHSSRRALAHSIVLHFPSLPPYYNIMVFLFISILSFLLGLFPPGFLSLQSFSVILFSSYWNQKALIPYRLWDFGILFLQSYRVSGK